MGTLHSKGFKITAESGVMKIFSGALVVMKGIRKNNNTYHYHGSTVIGTAAVTSSSEKDAEATRLWHMRFWHAGGKFLKTLASQRLLKWILWYICNTVDVGLVFQQGVEMDSTVHSSSIPLISSRH